MECEEFLEVIYGDREGWIDLPTKVGDFWVPFYTRWPADGVITRRIDSSLRDREDLYYSVTQFGQRGRRYEDVLPSSWLWADLDEVHPSEAGRSGFLPTLAVQSSPGRFQALWQLDRSLRPATLEKLNRALSYSLGADRGGWDLTQVLRIPGTRNFKYKEAPTVDLLWYNAEQIYNATEVWQHLKGVIPQAELQAVVDVKIPVKGISARARALLRTPADQVVEGERSARLWELECLLAESGLKANGILQLVEGCRWNKYAGTRDGRRRLRREIAKAIQHVIRQQSTSQREVLPATSDTSEEAEEQGLVIPFVRYSSFMAMRMADPKWLVKDIWTAGSQGIIGGEPKTSKTTIALALALSVASGRAFLGKFPVGVSGTVLFIQEENAPWMMQDRLRKLAISYGLVARSGVRTRGREPGDLARKGRVVMDLDFPRDVPLHVLNNFGFDLGESDCRDALWAMCEETRPALVVIDPLYLVMGDADTDRMSDIKPYLKWLLALRYEFGSAVILVHHMRKRKELSGYVRAGQNLMGSAILHGWVDSALYCSARETEREGWTSGVIEREFRSMAPQRSIELELNMGQPGDMTFECEIRGFDLGGLIEKRVREHPGITAAALAEMLLMDKRTLLARVRGGTLDIRLESGRRGRGYSHRLWPSDD